ncbi:hypothetical protein H2201_006127 [Coniosporium apollinis]|uniref:aldehyde dehydrogenase (NAD(+)) n=1 Tax=Coniosporium apollinis TaxID=61459 RepID=A0ABQ9NN56_9PEZI|nr:hypothetical protein H2201_006127 [Coniosporium apollinis]
MPEPMPGGSSSHEPDQAPPMIPDGVLPFPQLCARIHDRVTAFLAEDAPSQRLKSVQEQTRISLGVLEEALDRYSLPELSLSYNGGKDCLVLLILYLSALHSKGLTTLPGTDGQSPPIQCVYIQAPDPFQEVEDFVASSAKTYSLSLERYAKPMKAAFAEYLRDKPTVKAIFVGTRRTDPHGANLTHFDPTDHGWPNFMRIHPVIDWHYVEIWTSPKFQSSNASQTIEHEGTSNMSVETITTISPITNKPILTRNGLTDADLQALPKTATEAFKSYKNTPLSERQRIVKAALQLLNKRQDELANELTEQMGRPIAYTAKEITTAVARGEYLLKISGDALADTDGEPEKGFKRYIKKVPVGPVLVLFAWNYPYLILVNSVIPALLAGNSVIIKPSPQTPTIAEHFQEIFQEAGLPENVMQYFHCGSFIQLETLVRAPEIQLICFTGSVAGGLAVQRSASDRVGVRVGLELGGKDPAYVRPDVDVKWAAENIVDGAIFNSGQSCCSIERVYVAQEVHDEFVAAVQEELKGYKLGDPFDESTNIGPVVSKRSAETIRSHIKDALEKGAKDATPENESFKSPPEDGNYVPPTLLTGVTHEMTVMTEETFGPVIPVMKVTSDEEAVRLMNDSEFGLTASIWTKDVEHGHELADDVEAGTVFINRCDYPSPDLAWIGWKNSGKGQTLSKFGFEQFVKLKSYHIKDYPK